MVEYHEWVKIAFAVAKAQGFEASFGENSAVVEVAADVWNDRKSELQKAGTREAEAIAKKEISVS